MTTRVYPFEGSISDNDDDDTSNNIETPNANITTTTDVTTTDVCYLCLEPCNTKSPCKCKSYIHPRCLIKIKRQWNSDKCACCMQYFNPERRIMIRESRISDSDLDNRQISIRYNNDCSFCNILILHAFFIPILVGFLLYTILYFTNPQTKAFFHDVEQTLGQIYITGLIIYGIGKMCFWILCCGNTERITERILEQQRSNRRRQRRARVENRARNNNMIIEEV